jgi:hypothetical protein
MMMSRRDPDRRRSERRRSPESVFSSLAALLGPRLRQQSAFQLRMGLEAIPSGSGAVMVITIPASRTTPVEVHTYPAGVTVGFVEPVRTSA